MKGAPTVKYIGDVISEKGTAKDNIENRRNKGWGKIAEIVGILSEMPDQLRVVVGLKLRAARLCNGVLYSTEAWFSVSDVKARWTGSR